MQAIILAGGFGTRLQCVVSEVPKPMAPIGNKPFLAILLDDLQRQGFSHVVLAVCYLKETIINYFGYQYKNIKISYAVETEPLGTGGAIVNALQLSDNNHPTFIINGDTYLDLNYSAMFTQHCDKQVDFSMAVHQMQDCSRYGEVIINEEKNIVSFEHRKLAKSGLINAGVYLINPNILNIFEMAKEFSFEKDFLHSAINKINTSAFLTEKFFIDIGIPEDYQKMQDAIIA